MIPTILTQALTGDVIRLGSLDFQSRYDLARALHEEAERLVTAVSDAVPMLRQVAETDHDGHVELEIEEADEFMTDENVFILESWHSPLDPALSIARGRLPCMSTSIQSSPDVTAAPCDNPGSCGCAMTNAPRLRA